MFGDDAPRFAIGDTGPGGGVVFYVTDGGLHGLEATRVDLALSQWGCYPTALSGADGTAIGTGAINTADIVNGCSNAVNAADRAIAYMLNGKIGWHLPSTDELHELYLRKTLVGGFVSDEYWSSSEDITFGNFAWFQNFSTSTRGLAGKDGTFGVRPVRTF